MICAVAACRDFDDQSKRFFVRQYAALRFYSRNLLHRILRHTELNEVARTCEKKKHENSTMRYVDKK